MDPLYYTILSAICTAICLWCACRKRQETPVVVENKPAVPSHKGDVRPDGPPIGERSRVAGSLKPMKCSRCGAKVHDYVEYSDLDVWCPRCDDEADF